MLTKDFNEILGSEIISMTGGLMAGVMLASITQKIELIPALLILIPGFFEVRGCISGSLSARLSSALFLKVLKPKFHNSHILRGNIWAAAALGIFISVFLGLSVYFASGVFFGQFDIRIIFISLIAGILSNLIEIPLTIYATFWLFKKGHDPNNIMGPYLTTTGDIISIISILIALAIV